jgi:hypothetical protein
MKEDPARFLLLKSYYPVRRERVNKQRTEALILHDILRTYWLKAR